MLKMQRPKSFKDLVLGILIVAVLGVGAYFIADALKAELVPGDIVVRSGNEEITALQNVTGEQRKNGSKACGGHFEIEEVADEFPVIRMDKGIVLEASQDPYGAMYYTVYNEDFSELYYRSERFAYPENDGTYYVVVDTAWGDKNHYFSTEHGFTLVIRGLCKFNYVNLIGKGGRKWRLHIYMCIPNTAFWTALAALKSCSIRRRRWGRKALPLPITA